jgi:hypothetical protein
VGPGHVLKVKMKKRIIEICGLRTSRRMATGGNAFPFRRRKAKSKPTVVGADASKQQKKQYQSSLYQLGWLFEPRQAKRIAPDNPGPCERRTFNS